MSHSDILSFDKEHRWLSNFYPVPVFLDEVCYPSVENAYQAAKYPPALRKVFETCSAGDAKKEGRLRSEQMLLDWDERKLGVMRRLIAQKFAKGTSFASRLLRTGDCQIVEGNYWGDTFWGVCKGVGENNLGKLIMEQRQLLKGEV